MQKLATGRLNHFLPFTSFKLLQLETVVVANPSFGSQNNLTIKIIEINCVDRLARNVGKDRHIEILIY